MENKKMAITVAIAIIFVGVGTASAYNLVNRYVFNKLEKTANEELAKGNYSAALIIYDKLKDSSSEDSGFAEQANKTKNLLMTEETYFKATKAAEEEKWLDAEILLENSGALDNPEFKFYEESKSLYEQAKSLVNSYEKEVSDKISDLKQSVEEETIKRQQTESQLNTTISQKQQTENTLQSTTKLLEESQNKANEAQAQYEEEQRKAQEAERQAEKERLEKFTNEINVYVSMLKNGNDYLNTVITEIDRSSIDASILFYIGQAKVLFDEVCGKSLDLKQNRTPEGFHGTVDKITQSADLFNQASQSFRNAAFYIQDKGEEFNTHYNEAKNLKMQAYTLTTEIF